MSLYLSLMMTLSCPNVTIVNKTDTWTMIDVEEVKIATNRCKELYNNSPCLKIFTKVEENTYRAVCTKKVELKMSDELDDAVEFSKAHESFKPATNSNSRIHSRVDDVLARWERDEEKKPGQPVQYALHADGYSATTPTIQTLPAGVYDIKQDERAIYASPMAPPSGLLLELPEMKSDKVLEILEVFWNSENDYKEGNEFVIGGAQYKAGAILFGAQGTGKSCTIKLASRKMIERDGVIFYASIHPGSVIEFLTSFSKIEQNRKCVVVLEDLDTLIDKYGESQYLEMLDSAKTIDNVFFIATTNYPERLDPRIYSRPGRFSHVIKIGLPTVKAREAYLKAVLKNYQDIDYIVDNTVGFTVDHLASLCDAVYREKKDLKKEIERLRILFNQPKISDRGLGFGLNTEEEPNE